MRCFLVNFQLVWNRSVHVDLTKWEKTKGVEIVEGQRGSPFLWSVHIWIQEARGTL